MSDIHSTALPPQVIDLRGQRFSRLVVQSYAGWRGRKTFWLCRCDCGKNHTVAASDLKKGGTKSCGCLKRKHGKTRSPEYVAWEAMRRRCFNQFDSAYRLYGGRGISVCQRWKESFTAFYEDVGPRPSSKHSIDRIDNEGNYEPGNVRWATRTEQARNKRNNRLLTFQGETKPLPAWAEECGLSAKTLSGRLWIGWSIEDALTRPVRKYRRRAVSAHSLSP